MEKTKNFYGTPAAFMYLNEKLVLSFKRNRFYLDEGIYRTLKKRENKDCWVYLQIPLGTFLIPRDFTINFIEQKKKQGLWTNGNFNDGKIPTEMRPFYQSTLKL